MVSVLLAANVADGHVAPMLGVAEQFTASGHRVRFLTGDRFADAIPENSAHIEDLLREARERDEAVAGLASSATYAGDADPYVKPREFEDDEADDDDAERDDAEEAAQA